MSRINSLLGRSNRNEDVLIEKIETLQKELDTAEKTIYSLKKELKKYKYSPSSGGGGRGRGGKENNCFEDLMQRPVVAYYQPPPQPSFHYQNFR